VLYLKVKDLLPKIWRMEQAEIIATLREHRESLSRDGIEHLRLFGSKARGDDNPASDVDLIADYHRGRKLTVFDKAGLEVEISGLLKLRVDLCDNRMLKDEVRVRAEREAVLVF
jgi:predicted nucleotidyltransferase